MKIVFTGGGTGGHFYPIIAVAESVHQIVDAEKILGLRMYYYSDAPYDKEALFEQGLEFRQISAGKRRLYSSISNFFDLFKTGLGSLSALVSLFFLYPDVVFCKGGYASFPVVLAARILRIPVVVHDSDSVPGRVTVWAGKFAERIAVSYAEAAQYFPKDRVAVTGQPIRAVVQEKKTDGAYEYLKLDPNTPTILILGGSLGAEAINDVVLDCLPQLVEKYQIIHQTGPKNYDEAKVRAEFMLEKSEHKGRYIPFAFLNPLALKMAAGAAQVVVTRAGSSLFEIAAWGLPSIIVPIPEDISRDQTSNAFSYARHGGAVVIQQNNLSSAIFQAELQRFFADPTRAAKMAADAKACATPDAAAKIARVLVDIGLSHEA